MLRLMFWNLCQVENGKACFNVDHLFVYVIYIDFTHANDQFLAYKSRPRFLKQKFDGYNGLLLFFFIYDKFFLATYTYAFMKEID